MNDFVKDDELSKVSGGFGTGVPGPYKFSKNERIYVSSNRLDYYLVLDDVDTEDKDYIVMCNTYSNGILKMTNVSETAGHLATIRKYCG